MRPAVQYNVGERYFFLVQWFKHLLILDMSPVSCCSSGSHMCDGNFVSYVCETSQKVLLQQGNVVRLGKLKFFVVVVDSVSPNFHMLFIVL